MIKKQPYMNVGAAILFLIFSLLFFALLIRYFTIQISGEVDGQPLAEKARQKYEKTGVLEAQRGIIYDRNKEIIAEDTASYKLTAVLANNIKDPTKKPPHVENPRKTARELSKYIDMKEDDIYALLTKKGYFQVEFNTKQGRDIDLETKNKIEKLKLPGIIFMRDSKRYYPNGIFASHLIGYADRQEQKDGTYKSTGKMGIEKTLNSELTGKNGEIDYESDFWGYLLPNSKEKVVPAKDGKDVILSLDKKIQTFLEDAMNKVDHEYKPKKIIAIVANPKTGEILAMGQRPSFDPKTRVGIDKSWHNEAIENSFEPGSTMKIFTLAAAVQENVFDPNAKFKSGSYKVTDRSPPINDWKHGGWGSITYLEAVQRSSNVGFAKLANEKLGFSKLREYLTKFGLDRPTGIDLPDETAGKILFQYPIEKTTTAFGQGTAITPIQQIQAATAIANNGKMVKPHVINKIVDHDNGKVIVEKEPEVVGTPISAETAKKVRDILETVITSENGTGQRYKIDGYSVAGKTGTAQIPDPNGGYLTGPSNYVFSFLGMAPKDDPKLIVYVAVQQPEIDDYTKGAIPVSEIFKPVMKNSLQYLNIQPTSVVTKSAYKLPNLKGQSVSDTLKKLTAEKVETIVLGNGKTVLNHLPSSGTKLLEGEKVVLYTGGKITAPSMIGWSLRDCLKVADMADLKLNAKGSGYVVNQNIKPGSILKSGDYFIIDLKTPDEEWKERIKKSAEDGKKTEENSEVNVKD